MAQRSTLLAGTLAAGLLLVAVAACGGGTPDSGMPATGGRPDSGSAAEVAPPDPETIAKRERVIAEVNGAPVRAWQLDEVVAINKAQLEGQGLTLSEEDEPKLRGTALQVVIDNELIYQAAQAEGITADPRQVEQRLQEARSGFASEADYQNSLIANGITESDIRDQAAYQLVVQQYVQSLTGGVAVDEAAARALYEKGKQFLKEPEQVRAAFILVKTSPDDPPAQREDARKRIEEAHERIQKGEDFAQVAREYSQAPSAARGGDVGFFPRGPMAPQFEEMAFKLEVGAVSPVFETPFGLNILKVLDRKDERQLTFEEVKPNLMLAAAQDKEGKAIQEHVASLRQNATIEILDEDLRKVVAGGASG